VSIVSVLTSLSMPDFFVVSSSTDAEVVTPFTANSSTTTVVNSSEILSDVTFSSLSVFSDSDVISPKLSISFKSKDVVVSSTLISVVSTSMFSVLSCVSDVNLFSVSVSVTSVTPALLSVVSVWTVPSVEYSSAV